MKPVRPLLAVFLFAAFACGGAAAAQDDIRTLAARPVLPAGAAPWHGSDWLDRFYAARGYAPAWSPDTAAAAIALLRQAPADGLDAAEYDPDRLQRQLDGGGDKFDVALTAAMLHFLADLRLGRVRSDYHTRGTDERPAHFDPVRLLGDALDHGRVEDAADGARPKLVLYGRVRELLARYRTLAARAQPHVPVPDSPVEPGAEYSGVQVLHERLVELGDLPADAPAPQPQMFDDALAEGVQHFQSRHGLPEKGALDAATALALNVPYAQRIRALELALERLRWVPDLPAGPAVVVDLPVFSLWAFDEARPQEPGLEMRVIVGDALKTPTPLFVGQMRYLEFNPYWHVPRSITVKEIIPRLERSRGYLKRENMELVGEGGVTTRVDGATLGELRAGRLQVRQRPGPKNSLGPIKFAMPNPDDIYLHATPHHELFQRARRDLSHGCIRVERPAELARFVMGGQPDWDLGQIEAAMQPGPTRRVDLPAPVPVVLIYSPAIADAGGQALFGRDIYHRDPLLEQALRQHARQARAQIVPASSGPTE